MILSQHLSSPVLKIFSLCKMLYISVQKRKFSKHSFKIPSSPGTRTYNKADHTLLCRATASIKLIHTPYFCRLYFHYHHFYLQSVLGNLAEFTKSSYFFSFFPLKMLNMREERKLEHLL